MGVRVEVDLVLVRLVVSVVTGGAVVQLGSWVLDLLVCAVAQKPSPAEAERPLGTHQRHALDGG
jgi:hypothetical protein